MRSSYKSFRCSDSNFQATTQRNQLQQTDTGTDRQTDHKNNKCTSSKVNRDRSTNLKICFFIALNILHVKFQRRMSYVKL